MDCTEWNWSVIHVFCNVGERAVQSWTVRGGWRLPVRRAELCVDVAQGHPTWQANHVLGCVQFGQPGARPALGLPRRPGQPTVAIRSSNQVYHFFKSILPGFEWSTRNFIRLQEVLIWLFCFIKVSAKSVVICHVFVVISWFPSLWVLHEPLNRNFKIVRFSKLDLNPYNSYEIVIVDQCCMNKQMVSFTNC